jgi:hypothetical protein
MTTFVQKPAVFATLAAQKDIIDQVKNTVNQNEATIVDGFKSTVATLKSTTTEKLETAKSETATAIQASQQAVEAKAQAVEAARLALKNAEADLATAKKDHSKNVSGFNKAFNTAAKIIKTELTTETANALKAKNEAITAEEQKLSAAQKAGLTAVTSEFGKAVTYQAFTVADTTASAFNGTVAVTAAVGTFVKNTFAEAYQAESGVKVPANLKKAEPKTTSLTK